MRTGPPLWAARRRDTCSPRPDVSPLPAPVPPVPTLLPLSLTPACSAGRSLSSPRLPPPPPAAAAAAAAAGAMAEPANAAAYKEQSYWDSRFRDEASYDWL